MAAHHRHRLRGERQRAEYGGALGGAVLEAGLGQQLGLGAARIHPLLDPPALVGQPEDVGVVAIPLQRHVQAPRGRGQRGWGFRDQLVAITDFHLQP